MDPSVKEATKQAVVVAPPLEIALNQSEQVKDKVEECAQELSSINEVLKEKIAEHPTLEQVEHALHESEQVEDKVQECADDLSLAEFFKLVVA